jgi:hypothetical protein
LHVGVVVLVVSVTLDVVTVVLLTVVVDSHKSHSTTHCARNDAVAELPASQVLSLSRPAQNDGSGVVWPSSAQRVVGAGVGAMVGACDGSSVSSSGSGSSPLTVPVTAPIAAKAMITVRARILKRMTLRPCRTHAPIRCCLRQRHPEIPACSRVAYWGGYRWHLGVWQPQSREDVCQRRV